MAHLALVVDHDPVRRAEFTARVGSLFAGLPGVVAEAATGPFGCVWAVGPRAPASIHRAGDAFSLLLGYAIDDRDRWITAADLVAPWLIHRTDGVFDGYHVGIAFDGARGLAAAVDPLGLFPLYHGQAGEAVIVATTPEAFGCHPDFRERIDREALAGILLVQGPLDDRPLLSGVRRLARGHRLTWHRGDGLAAQAVHRLEGTLPPVNETAGDVRQRIDAELMRAVRRHQPPAAPTALLLSGGLDSRLVAGCLADLGAAARGVILGLPDDYEVRAGRAVAERLGLPHVIVATDGHEAEFPVRVRRDVRFGHLTAAPAGDDFALGLELADTSEPYFWSGIACDWAFEPIAAANGRDPATGSWSFEPLLATMNGWGVPIDAVPGLLGTDGIDLVATVSERLRAACHAGPSDVITQSGLLRWDQRIRNHIAQSLHATTFISWPLVPAIDRRLFAAILGLPVAAYERRRLERAVLLARRPDLAAIPLDTNSHRFEPLTGSTGLVRALERVASAGRKRLRGLSWALRGRDPRRYERLFDVNRPRWRAVRELAEPLRPELHEFLAASAVDRIWPGPAVPVGGPQPVRDGGPLRLLLGLALWCDRRAD